MTAASLTKTVAAVGLVLMLSWPAMGQVVSSRLEGLVQDQSQAVIPGVAIAATNVGTNIKYESVTNEAGRYVFVSLPPGPYTLTAELAGFKKVVHGGILLQIGDARTVNMVLETGDISENVTVVAETPLIDLTTTKIGSVVETRQILDLPLLGRNAMMLYYLQGGTNPKDSVGGQQQRGGVDGLAPNTNNVKVEGIAAGSPAYDHSPAAPISPVPQEAVGEYRVTTSGAGAEAGRGSGAQVSVFLKSGTNELHGSVFEFVRNTAFNANNFFSNRAGVARPTFQRHQFGFSVGGPIIKNRTFFFGTAEWQRQNEGIIQNRQVYTPALRQGIFRYNTQDANSTSVVDANGNPLVPIGTIDLLSVDPTRQGMDTVFLPSLLKVMPLPNNYDVGDGLNLAGYSYTTARPDNWYQWLLKIDHELSNRHHLSVSSSRFDETSYTSPGIDGIVTELRRNIKYATSLRLLSTFSPRLSNEFNIGGSAWDAPWPALHPLWDKPSGHIILTGLGNGNIFTDRTGQSNPAVNLGFSDNANWITGNHTVTFGGEFWYQTLNRSISFARGTGARGGNGIPFPVITTNILDNPANVPALPGLSSADRTRAQQLTNDLTGAIGTISQTFFLIRKSGYTPYEYNYQQVRQINASTYIQDIWKLRPSVSLNLGLRYELLPPGWIANVFVNPIGGAAGALGVQGPTGQPTRWGFAPKGGRGIMRFDKNNFAPRAGFSWDVFGKGRMTMSGSYGISYDRSMMVVFADFSTENYSSATAVTLTPFTRLSDPKLYGDILPIPVPQLFAPLGNTRDSRAYAVDPNIAVPYVQTWNFRLAQQIGANWRAEASYVGNHAVGQWRAENMNQIEMHKNGFLNAFKIAQSNLQQNGNPTTGQGLGPLDALFRLVPSSQYNLISQGQAGALADFLDTTTLVTGVRGGLVTRAGLPDTFFRFNPQVQNLNIVGNRNHSTWNGLKLAISRRMDEGLYVQGNYTFGKGLTDYVSQQVLFDPDYRDNANPRLDRTYNQFDSTHTLSVNWIYELPFGQGRRMMSNAPMLARTFLGGWQLNGIYSWVTGRPLRVTTGRFNLNANVASTPNFTGPRFHLSKVYKDSQITTLTTQQRAQFSNPGAGQAGDLPLWSLRGPGYSNLDMSMFKKFPLAFLGENVEAQFRVEFYNALNTTNFQEPAVNTNSGNFGVISSALPARIGQLALKIIF
jgi:hypothetical protein